MWKRCDDALVVLAGSPDRLIGQRVVREGCEISSTGDAADSMGSGEILRAIRADEIPFVTVGGKGEDADTVRPRRKIRVKPFLAELRAPARWRAEPYTRSTGGLLAAFCANRLITLPETRIETVFRIYSKLSAAGENFLEDLEAGYGSGQSRHASRYRADGLELARQLAIGTLRTVYVGSPVYKAVA